MKEKEIIKENRLVINFEPTEHQGMGLCYLMMRMGIDYNNLVKWAVDDLITNHLTADEKEKLKSHFKLKQYDFIGLKR